MLRTRILKFLRIKHHEDLVNWLDSSDVLIAKNAFDVVFHSFPLSEDERGPLEKSYELAKKNGCTLNGYELRLVFYLELAKKRGVFTRNA